MTNNYIRKNVSFNPADKKDVELYNRLKQLGHGEFSKRTKELWRKELIKKEEQA